MDSNNIAQKRYEYIGSEELPEDLGLMEAVKQRSSFTIKKNKREALFLPRSTREGYWTFERVFPTFLKKN